jgi:hyperosmotically inducible protein
MKSRGCHSPLAPLTLRRCAQPENRKLPHTAEHCKMNTRIQHTGLLAAALALLVAGGSAVANDNDPQTDRSATADSDQPVDDTWITTKVKASLLADEDVAGLQVDVETVNGVVTLSGDVDSQAQIDEALRIASGIEGVTDVDTTGLRVDPTE